MPIAYFLCNYLLLICFLRLNWDRYYVPTELSMRVLAAIGIAELAVAALQRTDVWKRGTRIGDVTEGVSMRTTLAAGVTLIVAAMVPVAAHHSFAAEFDAKQPVLFKGTVRKWSGSTRMSGYT